LERIRPEKEALALLIPKPAIGHDLELTHLPFTKYIFVEINLKFIGSAPSPSSE
jgi:hypothetical protein